MKIDLIKPGLALAAVLFFVLYLHQCSQPRPDDSIEYENIALKERVVVLNAAIQKAGDSLKALQALRDTQRKAYEKDSTILVKQSAALSRRYQTARTRILELEDSTGRIAAFTNTSDSLIAVKDSTIAVERNARMAEGKLHYQELAVLADRNVKQIQISDEYAARVSALESKLTRSEKRLERKRKANGVWKGLALGLGAATAVLILAK